MADVTIRAQGAAIGTEFDLNSMDSGGAYSVDLVETSWGVAEQPEPKEEPSVEGVSIFRPPYESWQRRVIKLVGAVECSSWYDKEFKRSYLSSLFYGRRTLRRYGWEIDVDGKAPQETSASRGSLLLEYEVTLLASPPFWRMVSDLDGLAYDAYMYPGFQVPYGEAQPSYDFYRTAPGGTPVVDYGTLTATPTGSNPHMTINNWGTAFCYAAASLTGFPNSTDLYLEGLGTFRVKLTTNGSGAATLAETDRLVLKPGDNPIRFEDYAGSVITLGASARANFGSTKMRFL